MPTVVLIRHGDALNHASRDADRRLSPIGIEEAKQVAKAIHGRVEVRTIVTSPYVRARETAAIVQTELMLDSVTEVPFITPFGDCDTVSAELAGMGDGVVVVTHQPLISDLVAYLTGQHIAVPTGTAVAISSMSYAQYQGEILWVERG